MKFGFVTCVQLGQSCMDAIYEVGGHLDLVITLEDSQAVNKSGRVYLDEFCKANSIPLIKSTHINNENCLQAIEKYKIDWLFIIGWSQIANKSVLSAPNKGVLGIHPTLLPQGRGRASIPWAILKGLEQTGVTLFKLDEGVDTGDIVEQLVLQISCDTDASELYKLVNEAHIDLIKSVYPKLNDDNVELIKQDHSKATEWPGRGPDDGLLKNSMKTDDALRLIRAVTHPYPGAFISYEGNTLVIWKAHKKESNEAINNDFLELKFSDGVIIAEDYSLNKRLSSQ